MAAPAREVQQAVPVGVVDERAGVVVGLGQEYVRVDEHRLPSFAGVVLPCSDGADGLPSTARDVSSRSAPAHRF
jgi:hypothetical protein